MPNVEAKADVKIGSSATATIRLLMELSPELNAKLEELAKETKAERSDILLRAIVLYDLVIKAQAKGKHMAFVDDTGKITDEIIGV